MFTYEIMLELIINKLVRGEGLDQEMVNVLLDDGVDPHKLECDINEALIISESVNRNRKMRELAAAGKKNTTDFRALSLMEDSRLVATYIAIGFHPANDDELYESLCDTDLVQNILPRFVAITKLRYIVSLKKVLAGVEKSGTLEASPNDKGKRAEMIKALQEIRIINNQRANLTSAINEYDSLDINPLVRIQPQMTR